MSELVQRTWNFVPELEAAPRQLWRDAGLRTEELYPGLLRYLEREHGVAVEVARWGSERRGAALRRRAQDGSCSPSCCPRAAAPSSSPHQIGLLTQRAALDRLSNDPRLTTAESRALARVSLANYFAGAVLMPYEPFISACREERYDIDVLGRRFRWASSRCATA